MAEAVPVPDCLTVEEAARVLRVGRTSAYALARQWRETGGRAGLPVVSFGTCLRVPTAALEQLLGRPITHIPPKAARPEPGAGPAAITHLRPAEAPTAPAVRPARSRRGTGTRAQASLPL
jgi:hypothetical protein